MVVLAIGVQPESDLAREAGLELGPKGHIRVDAHLRTSDPAIYAVGDAIEVVHPILQAPTAVPLAGPANRQARIAADHITGADVGYRGTYGTAIVKVFGLTAALTGTNSRALEQQGIAFLTSITHSPDHVTYYPGAAPQTLKLLYRPDDGRLLGAQVVGRQAVDRTIHTLATALQAGMTVYDLEHLELAYAPPYGAAKDPVNIAGYVAANRLRGDTELVEWSRVQELVAGDMEGGAYGILDVRSEPEWALGHIPGALHIPNTELRSRLDALDRSKTWIVYCKVGRRAYVMERMLRQHGFRVQNLSGGWDIYALASAARTAHAAASEAPTSAHRAPRTGERPPARRDWERGNGHAPPTPMPAAVEAAARLSAVGLHCRAHPGRLPPDAGHGERRGARCRPAIGLWARCDCVGRHQQPLAGPPRGGRHHHRAPQRVPALAIADATAAAAPAKTMVVFSGDLDHALASFVIANGAAAMGQRVTMFFTFWGLNVLRRREAPPVPRTSSSACWAGCCRKWTPSRCHGSTWAARARG